MDVVSGVPLQSASGTTKKGRGRTLLISVVVAAIVITAIVVPTTIVLVKKKHKENCGIPRVTITPPKNFCKATNSTTNLNYCVEIAENMICDYGPTYNHFDECCPCSLYCVTLDIQQNTVQCIGSGADAPSKCRAIASGNIVDNYVTQIPCKDVANYERVANTSRCST